MNKIGLYSLFKLKIESLLLDLNKANLFFSNSFELNIR